MITNYFELFEKMRTAGKLAAKTLDQVTSFVKPGVNTNFLDKLCNLGAYIQYKPIIAHIKVIVTKAVKPCLYALPEKPIIVLPLYWVA